MAELLNEISGTKENEQVKSNFQLAEQGDAVAQYKLGYSYYHGKGITQDYTQAVNWYRKAAEQGLAEAQFGLGMCFDYGDGVTEDKVQAVNWYRKAAEQGRHAAMQYVLADCYASGKGVTKDMTIALDWYHKAAEQGYAKAQFILGLCFACGKGVTEDITIATNWFRKAADQGHAEAQFNLGNCYYDGEGVIKDIEQAIYWFRKAAEQGHAKAQFNLGNCFFNGEGVSKDMAQAIFWYRKSVEHGYAEAQLNLDLCLEHKDIPFQNFYHSLKWLVEATKQELAMAIMGENSLGIALFRQHLSHAVIKLFSMQMIMTEVLLKTVGDGDVNKLKKMDKIPKEKMSIFEKALDDLGETWRIEAHELTEKNKASQEQYDIADGFLSIGQTVASSSLDIFQVFHEKNLKETTRKYADSLEDSMQDDNFIQTIKKLAIYYSVDFEEAKSVIFAVQEEYKMSVENQCNKTIQLKANRKNRKVWNIAKWIKDIFCGRKNNKNICKDMKDSIAVAQFNKGVDYYKGIGVTRDHEQAVKFFRNAAERGFAQAQFVLGYCIANGYGVTRDQTQAVIWYQKAAEQGYAEAQFRLGDSYFDGYGITQDLTQAINWYQKAAEQGHSKAQFNLGTIYENGDGLEKDENTALYWYEKAIKGELEENRLKTLAKNSIKELKAAGYSSANAKIL